MNLWAWNSEGNIRKSWGKCPASSVVWGRPKTTSWNPQNVNHCWTFTEQNKNGFFELQQWGKPQQNYQGGSQPLSISQLKFPAMGKTKETTKNVSENAPSISNFVRKKTHGWLMDWEDIFQHLLAQEAKTTFSKKWVTPQIRIWTPYLSHPMAITSFTNFWWLGIKDKNGSWPFNGFSPKHLAYPPWTFGFSP